MSDRWQYLGGGEWQGTGWSVLLDTEDPQRVRVEIRPPEGNWRHKTVTFK